MRDKTIKIFRKSTIIKYIIYKLILDIIYINWVHPIYWYTGFDLNFDIYRILISIIFFISILVILPRRESKIYELIMHTQAIFMIIPMITIYEFTYHSGIFMTMIVIVFYLQSLILRILPPLKVKKINLNQNKMIRLFWLFTILVYIYLLRTQKIHFSVFDFNSTLMYDIRSEQDFNNVMSYLVNWQFRVVTPFLAVYYFLKEKYSLVFACSFLQILMYTIVSRKEVIFSIALVAFVLFIWKFKLSLIRSLLSAINIFSIIFIFIYEIFNQLYPLAIIPTRLIFVPARNKFWHYEFFKTNKKLFYSEGLIGKIFNLDYPYNASVGYVVSGGKGNSNTGYLAYAYDNAGFLGMLLITLVFILLIYLISSYTENDDTLLAFSVIIYPIIVLNDGDLLSLLLTGGFVINIFIFMIFKIRLKEDL